MKKIITSLFLLYSLSINAQTKLINHRSHSGSNETFADKFANDAIPNSNLGASPTRIVLTAKLDSLIYVNDSTAVMVTSRFCADRYDVSEEPTNWKPGKDTIRSHPLFGKQHQLDVIKRTIKNDYNFNDAKNIKYIGYDNFLPQEIKPKVKPKQEQNNIPKMQQQNLQNQNMDETNLPFQTFYILASIGTIGIFFRIIKIS
jgi:hypothetical protein